MTIIQDSLKKLMSDKKCGPMATASLKKLGDVAASLPQETAQDQDSDSSTQTHRVSEERILKRQLEIPNEIAQLSVDSDNLMTIGNTDSSALAQAATKSAIRRTLEFESGRSQFASQKISNSLFSGDIEGLAKSSPNDTLRNRVSQVSQNLVSSLDGVLDEMSRATQCMPGTVGSGADRAALFGSVTRVLTALASSNSTSAVSLSNAAVKAIKLSIANDYQNAQNDLNFSDNLMRLGCLLESLTNNYCGTRDIQQLLASVANDKRQNGGREISQFNDKSSPFYGFYVTRRSLPIVSEWIGNILYPKVTSLRHSNLEQLRLVNIFDLSRISKGLRGHFNNGVRNIEILREKQKKMERDASVDAKSINEVKIQVSAAIVNMIDDLTKYILTNSRLKERIVLGGDNTFSTMFYKGMQSLPSLLHLSFPSYYIPLRLLGIEIKEIPERVALQPGKRIDSTFVINWLREDDYHPLLNNDGDQRLTIFDDPDRLVNTIGNELENKIIKLGHEEAINFFISRGSIDFKLYISDFFAPRADGRSVESAFLEIQSYLLHLSTRYMNTEDYGFQADKVIATINLIDDVIATIKDARNDKNLEKNYIVYIKKIFTNLRLIEMQSAYLSDRVITAVNFDLNKQIQAASKNGNFDSSWLALARSSAIATLASNLGTDPNQISQSLAMAQNLNLTNLSSFQTSMSQFLVSQLAYLQAVEIGKHGNADRLTQTLDKAYENSRYLPRIAESRSKNVFYDTFLDFVELTPIRATARIIMNPILYPMPGFLSRSASLKSDFKDDKFHSLRQLRSEICILTLGLPNPEIFWDVCRGANRMSIFDNPEADNKLTSTMSVTYDDKIAKFRSAAENNTPLPLRASQNNICLSYDAKRREAVYWDNILEIDLRR